MAQIHNRRHQDYRSIDFDFYRTQAVALRSQAMRDGTALKAAATVVLTVVSLAAILMLVAIASAPAS